jgi:hypothetical protein
MELDQLTCPRSTTSHCSISGKYSQTLRITNIKDSDEGEYKCSYAAGKNESYALTLTVINDSMVSPADDDSNMPSTVAPTDEPSILPSSSQTTKGETVGTAVTGSSHVTTPSAKTTLMETKNPRLTTEGTDHETDPTVPIEIKPSPPAIEPHNDVTSNEGGGMSVNTNVLIGLVAGTVVAVLTVSILLIFIISRSRRPPQGRNSSEDSLRQDSGQLSDSGDSSSNLQNQQQNSEEPSSELFHSGDSFNSLQQHQSCEGSSDPVPQSGGSSNTVQESASEVKSEVRAGFRDVRDQLHELKDIFLDTPSTRPVETYC